MVHSDKNSGKDRMHTKQKRTLEREVHGRGSETEVEENACGIEQKTEYMHIRLTTTRLHTHIGRKKKVTSRISS